MEAELKRCQENLEKVRKDMKVKVDRLSYLEGQAYFMEDKLRNAESRAAEAEKKEDIIESLRDRLDSSLSECRDKERGLKTSHKDLENTKSLLEKTNSKVEELSTRVIDLKVQIKEELLRNENMEQQLDELDMLRDDLKEKDRRLVELRAEMDQKSTVLDHARMTLRKERERMKGMENKMEDNCKLREDLALAQAEALTLKRLLIGKDSLLVQRSQSLHLAKELIQELDPSGLSASSQQHIDRPRALYPQGVTFRDPDKRKCLKDGSMADFEKMQKCVNNSEGKSKKKLNGHMSSVSCITFGEQDENNRLLELILQDDHHNNSQDSSPTQHDVTDVSHYTNTSTSSTKTRTSSLKPHSYKPDQTFLNFRHARVRSTESLNKSERPGRTLHESHASRQRSALVRATGRPKTSPSNGWCEKVKGSRPVSAMSSASHNDPGSTDNDVSAFERDLLYIKFIHVGDRVIVILPTKKGKEQLCKGMVKYVGEVDREVNDFRIYVGVKLDEPVGDTDGLYKGKRYFTCPEKNGKVLRITRVKAVLSHKASTFTPIQECINNYKRLGVGETQTCSNFKSR